MTDRKRILRPLDIHNLRLYKVIVDHPYDPKWQDICIVAARSPSHAAEIINEIYADTEWIDGPPIISGHQLNIYQPESWYEDD